MFGGSVCKNAAVMRNYTSSNVLTSHFFFIDTVIKNKKDISVAVFE